MRFLSRATMGLFLLAATLGLLGLAGLTLQRAYQAASAEEGGPRPQRERVFAAEVVIVEPQTLSPVLTAFGEITARRTLELRAPAAGEVVELAEGFEEGGAVTAGQLLLRVDPAEAEDQLASAQTDLREAQAELADAERALELAQLDVEAARNQAELQARALDRQQGLLERGVGSPAAVETAELAAAGAQQSILSRRQALAQAQSRLELAGTGLERRQIALRQAERALAETELRAGFDGVLSDVAVAQGRLVGQNERLATLIDARDLEVAFRISTAQYARLLTSDGGLPEAQARVVLDVLGLDVTAPATLTRESGSVAEGQSGRLLFAGLDTPRGFRVGDFVTVEVIEPALERVALIPATAIDGENRVLVLGAEDRLEEVTVELLRRQGNDVIIAARDLAGREVVTARTPVLGEGIRIRPLRPGDADAPAEPQTIALDPERRARLIAFVEGNTRMPSDVRDRLLQQLAEDEVPAAMVDRLESRMGS